MKKIKQKIYYMSKKIIVENGHNIFSPRHRSPFDYKDKHFINVYQFFLYCQANNAGLKDEAEQFLNARNNSQLYGLDAYNKKGCGGMRKASYSGKLSENLTEYAKVGMREKFRQNPQLLKELMKINVNDIKIKEGMFNKEINIAFEEGLKLAFEQIKLENSLSKLNKKYNNSDKKIKIKR